MREKGMRPAALAPRWSARPWRRRKALGARDLSALLKWRFVSLPRKPRHEPAMRHRGPAQCGQVHSLQRPHQAGIAAENYPSGTIRAEHLAWSRCRSAPGPAGRHHHARSAWCRPSSSSWTSPAWWPAPARARPGNQFLAHIRETDAIVNVVRCFEDPNVIHVVAGKVDPISDIEVIQTELCLADLATVEKALNRYSKGRQERQRQGGGQAGVVADAHPGRAQRGQAGARHSGQRKTRRS